MASHVVRPGRMRTVDLVCVLVVAFCAGALLWLPEFGDQAFYRLGASQLRSGWILYRDFWDIKQPGIFVWYVLGDRIGLGDVGVRVLEALALLACVPILRSVAGRLGWSPTVTAVAPVLLAVPYVGSVGSQGVGQIEGVVTVLLLGQYALALKAGHERSVRFGCAAGLVGGVVLVFKAVYLPVVLIILAATSPHLSAAERPQRSAPGPARSWWPVAAAAVAGLAVVPAVTASYFAAQGLWTLFSVTTFVLPPQIAALPGTHPPGGAFRVARAVVAATSLTGVLALPALLRAIRPGTGARGRHDRVPVAWALTAGLLAFLQFPTAFRAMLLVAPMVLLAASGLDRWNVSLNGSRPRIAVGAVAVLVLTLPLLTFPAALFGSVARAGFSLSANARHRVADDLTETHDKIDRIVASAPPEIARGATVFLFTDPTVYRVLGVEQAIEMNGWSPDQMTAQMWAETLRELDRSRPKLIYVETGFLPYLEQGDGRRVLALLDRLYAPAAGGVGPDGVWWTLPVAGLPAPTAEGNLLADPVPAP